MSRWDIFRWRTLSGGRWCPVGTVQRRPSRQARWGKAPAALTAQRAENKNPGARAHTAPGGQPAAPTGTRKAPAPARTQKSREKPSLNL